MNQSATQFLGQHSLQRARFGAATAIAVIAVCTATLLAVTYAGSTTMSAVPNPVTLGAGDDVTLTTTTTAPGATAALISEGKVQYQIATDGLGALVDKDFVGAVWIRFDSFAGGTNPDGLGETSLAVDLDALSAIAVVPALQNAQCDDVIGFRAHYITGGGKDKVDTHFGTPINVTVECVCELPPALTRSQGFYGNNNGSDFLNLYLGALSVGTGYTMSFTDAAAIHAYMTLPGGGTPEAMTGSVVDPTDTDQGGIFGKQVTALKLNVLYYDVLISPGTGSFAALTLNDPTSAFHGMTVAAILAAAETALGGGALLPGTTIGGVGNSSYNDLVDQLNLAFDNDFGTPSAWALLYLSCS